MQAVAHLIEQLTAQLTPEQHATRQGFQSTVITPSPPNDAPSTQRWSESPFCSSDDDVDEDEAYFLDEDDDDDDDDDDEYTDDDDDDLDEDDDEIEKDKDLDEDDF